MILKSTQEPGNINSTKFVTVIMMILCLSLIPLIIISLFSRPYLDDYNYAMDTVQLIQSGNWNVVSLVKTAFDVDMHFYNLW